ncbi:MAG: sodium:dicarboxylate symporter [Chlamydiae bacterium RIFCSPLOWO2_01_FULL_28_7]|nr:MAG: sodium:dicarboxylate symporter [Chlamydiae bacterium RIFCSPLOWO2_01_FULL_28_7]
MKSWLKILIGLLLGVSVGLIFGEKAQAFQIFGEIFIRLLTMLVLLIIFTSVIVGICHINNPQKLSRIGFKTITFYIVTTMIAIIIGIIVVKIIKPGDGLSIVNVNLQANHALTLKDLILSLVPSNPFKAFADGNILQVIIFSILFAVAIIFSKEKGKPILKLLESVGAVMHKLTHFVMLLAPYGVFALMASTIGKIGMKALVPLMKFLLCNYIACFIQLFIVFGAALKYLTKVKILPFYKGMKDAIVVALTTSSSSATLPVTLECTQKHLGVSEDISGFVLSLGTTINMNGGAIGQAISAIFIAQAYGILIGPLQILVLILVSTLSAIGAPGVPGAGLVMLSLVLNVMGLPLEGISLVIGVDRLREMVSTVVNVTGDAVAATFVAKTEGELDEKIYHAATWTDSDI